MAEKQQQYGVVNRELHWLYNPFEYSQALRKTTLMQTLFSMDKVNPALVAQENSSKPSPNFTKSNGGSPKEKGTSSGKLFGNILAVSYAIASATAVAPIERVCILMQCQNEMIKAGRLSTPYKGMTDCLLRTIKHEGVISLWRGNSVNAIRLCVAQALPFILVHLNYTKIQKKMNESPPWVLIPFAVLPTMLWRHPLDYARVRLANDVKATEKLKFSLDSTCNIGNRQFNGLFDVYKKTLKLDGIRGLYRGLSVSCIGLVAHLAMITTLSGLKTKSRQQPQPIEHKEKRDNSLYIVAILIWLSLPAICYPFSTVSRRMMMMSASRETIKYRGAMNAFY